MNLNKSQLNENSVTSTASQAMVEASQFLINEKFNARFADVETFFSLVLGREYPKAAAIPQILEDRCHIQMEEIQGYPVYTLTPKENRSDVHIIFVHGGAWVLQLAEEHWKMIHKLIEDNGATVTVPVYPLAPESNHKKAYPFLEAVYRNVISETAASKIVLCGDSAGGQMVLSQCILYRDLGLPLPKLVIVFSPCVDMTFSNPDIQELEVLDVVIAGPGGHEAAKMWIAGGDPKSPIFSPLYGDLAGLPPIRIFIGTHELLLPDNRLFNKKIRQAGGDIRLYEYAGAFHCFSGIIPALPESQDVYEKVKQAVTELVKQHA